METHFPQFDRTAQQEVNDALAEANGKLVLRVKELEEALRPFAAVADRYSENSPDYNHVHSGVGITVGQCRRARAALKEQP